MIKGTDGYMQGRQFVENYIADIQTRDHVIADLRDEIAMCYDELEWQRNVNHELGIERDRYKASASLARESLRIFANYGDLLIEALGVMRMALTGLSVGTIKRIENIRQVIRTVQDGYGGDA